MTWTTDPPKTAGWFWWRVAEGDEHPIVRMVCAWPAGGFVAFDRQVSRFSDGIIDVEELRGQWIGPLEAPK